MDEHDPLDARLADALRADDPVDAAGALAAVVRHGRRRRAQRRVALGAGLTAVALAIGGIAIATNNTGTARLHVAGRNSTTTSGRRVTSSVASATTTTRPAATTTTPASSVPVGTTPTSIGLPATTVSPPPGGSTPSTTAPIAASPWPAGTYVKSDHLTSVVTFDPPQAMFGQTINASAVITNPDDTWVFASLEDELPGVPCPPPPYGCSGTAGDLGIDVGVNANAAYILARGDDPALLHNTAAGTFYGLLLPPHGSYRMSGSIQINGALGDTRGPQNGPWTLDAGVVVRYGGHADPAGFGFGKSSTGTLTLLPNPIVTTPTTTPAG